MKASILLATFVTFLFGYNLGYQQYNDEYKQLMSNGITFRWKVDNGSLNCQVSAPTQGWLSVGFKNASGLTLSNQVMGTFRDGQSFCEDRYVINRGDNPKIEDIGGSSAIEQFEVFESNGMTEFHFSIPCDPMDGYHYNLNEGETVFITLGYSRFDDFEQQPVMRIETKVLL